jgi:hypothetical protein
MPDKVKRGKVSPRGGPEERTKGSVSVKVMIPKRHETRTDLIINDSMLEKARELAGWSKECDISFKEETISSFLRGKVAMNF